MPVAKLLKLFFRYHCLPLYPLIVLILLVLPPVMLRYPLIVLGYPLIVPGYPLIPLILLIVLLPLITLALLAVLVVLVVLLVVLVGGFPMVLLVPALIPFSMPYSNSSSLIIVSKFWGNSFRMTSLCP